MKKLYKQCLQCENCRIKIRFYKRYLNVILNTKLNSKNLELQKLVYCRRGCFNNSREFISYNNLIKYAKSENICKEFRGEEF